MKTRDIEESLMQYMIEEFAAQAPRSPAKLVEVRQLLTPLVHHIVASGLPCWERWDEGSLLCLRCGSVTYNPKDINNQYCGWCHKFPWDKVSVSNGGETQ